MEMPFIHTRAALKLGLPFHAACLSSLLLHGQLFSLGTFPISSLGLLLRAPVSQRQTRLRRAAHRLVNHVSKPEKLCLQG